MVPDAESVSYFRKRSVVSEKSEIEVVSPSVCYLRYRLRRRCSLYRNQPVYLPDGLYCPSLSQ